jgi:hypothetical protein
MHASLSNKLTPNIHPTDCDLCRTVLHCGKVYKWWSLLYSILARELEVKEDEASVGGTCKVL